MHGLTKATTAKNLLIGAGLFISLLLSNLSATASIVYYKSIGEYGETRYTQFPPKNDSQFESITMRSDGRKEDGGAMAESVEMIKQEGDLSQSNQQLSPPIRQSANKPMPNLNKPLPYDKFRRCQILRHNLTSLNIGGKVFEIKRGKKRYLNKSQIAYKRNLINQAIQQHCLS